ncbi:MAG: MjaI family restriction endonuclease [Gammaproteobacteria bacterium]|nr:MjaI family restriction endonuclease [Gammaproteobacteria bacterium]MYF37924.1 MjaI family restriction endonuclease [Gammaproteobacteria bacterium]
MSKLITLSLSNVEVFGIEPEESTTFPEYTSSLINLANNTAQATRPRVVGQMSELVQEYKKSHPQGDLRTWYEWYTKRYPQALEQATAKTYAMLQKYIEALAKVDEDMVREWVSDLVIKKSYQGIVYQEICIRKVAEYYEQEYRLATPSEESEGINGFIGNVPVQVQSGRGPYHVLMDQLTSPHRLIRYDTSSDGSLVVEFLSDIFASSGG